MARVSLRSAGGQGRHWPDWSQTDTAADGDTEIYDDDSDDYDSIITHASLASRRLSLCLWAPPPAAGPRGPRLAQLPGGGKKLSKKS